MKRLIAILLFSMLFACGHSQKATDAAGAGPAPKKASIKALTGGKDIAMAASAPTVENPVHTPAHSNSNALTWKNLSPYLPLSEPPDDKITDEKTGEEPTSLTMPVIAEPSPSARIDYGSEKRLGGVYAARGNLDAALKAYERAAEIRTDDADLYFSMGNISLRLKRPPEAVAHYKRASELEPSNPSYLNNLAWALMEVGRIDDALKSVRRALSHDPEAAYIYLDTRGVIETRERKFRTANATLKEALARTPRGNTDARLYILTHFLELYRLSGNVAAATRTELMIEETRKRTKLREAK